MKIKWVVGALVALVAVIGVVGCGSDEDTLTKAEYVKQGNEICAKGIAKKEADVDVAIEKQKKSGKPMSTREGEALVTDVALPPLQTMTEELADLSEPDSGAEQAEAVVAAFEEGIETSETKTAKVLDATLNPFGKAEKAAASFGLKDCSDV